MLALDLKLFLLQCSCMYNAIENLPSKTNPGLHDPSA